MQAAGLFLLARKAMLDRDEPDAFPFLALARIRSSRSCGAVNRRGVYSGACVGHLKRASRVAKARLLTRQIADDAYSHATHGRTGTGSVQPRT